MKKTFDISAMQYMRAHGNEPGPTHRPYLTGAISGILAAVPSLILRYCTGALAGEAEGLGLTQRAGAAIDALILTLAGVVYATIFKRAANDKYGGWLFGISYGFLTWMIGPVAMWQMVTGKPLGTGIAAMGLFGAQLLFGLILGGLYPYMNRLMQRRMR